MSCRNPLEGMGRWLKEQGVIRRERTDAEMIALALFLYTKGLSTRQVARVLGQLGVKVSHIAVWRWVHKYIQMVNPKALRSPRPRSLMIPPCDLAAGGSGPSRPLILEGGRSSMLSPIPGGANGMPRSSWERFGGSWALAPEAGDRWWSLVPDVLSGACPNRTGSDNPEGFVTWWRASSPS